MTNLSDTRKETAMQIEKIDGETFTQRCRKLLQCEPGRLEFTLSRAALEMLVKDSERYADSNKASNELLLAARDIMSMTTMMTRDSDAWLTGEWDHLLPGRLRLIARGVDVTIDHDCSKARRP